MPDLSGAAYECRTGTAKNFTLLLLLYLTQPKVSGIKRCSCWAHIRRYFVDVIPKGKQLDYNQPAVQGVHYCDRLARLESTITSKCGTDYEKRKQMRLEKEKPVLEAFWAWVDSQNPTRNTRLDKALTYVKNRRETSMTYLEDGRCHQ